MCLLNKIGLFKIGKYSKKLILLSLVFLPIFTFNSCNGIVHVELCLNIYFLDQCWQCLAGQEEGNYLEVTVGNQTKAFSHETHPKRVCFEVGKLGGEKITIRWHKFCIVTGPTFDYIFQYCDLMDGVTTLKSQYDYEMTIH